MGNKLEWRVRLAVDEHGDAIDGTDYSDNLSTLVQAYGKDGNEFELVRWIDEYVGSETAEWNGSSLDAFDYTYIEPSRARQREARKWLA